MKKKTTAKTKATPPKAKELPAPKLRETAGVDLHVRKLERRNRALRGRVTVLSNAEKVANALLVQTEKSRNETLAQLADSQEGLSAAAATAAKLGVANTALLREVHELRSDMAQAEAALKEVATPTPNVHELRTLGGPPLYNITPSGRAYTTPFKN